MTDSHVDTVLSSPIFDEACHKALGFERVGEVAAAEAVYRAVLQVEPRHVLANYQLGLLLLQLRQAEAAILFLLAALEVSPETADYWLSYIEALIQAEQFNNARATLALGRVHGLTGLAIDALSARLEAKLPEPLNTLPAGPAASQSGRPGSDEEAALIALLDRAEFNEGVAQAQMMTQRFPRHSFGWKILGALLRSQGNSLAALVPMQKSVKLAPKDAQALSNLGLVLGDLQRHTEAEVCHRRALKINPQFADGFSNLGSTLKALGRLTEAEASFRKALALMPDHAEAYNNLGVTLYDQGRLAEAEAAYVQALALQPEYAEACNNLANVLRKQLRPAEAEKHLRQALVYRPDFADAHYNLASTLRELGQLNEALKSFQDALQLKPDFVQALLNFGLTSNELGDLSQAERAYRTALKIDPDFAAGHNNLGSVLRQQGCFPEAEAAYRQALAIKPNDAEVFSNLLFNHCCRPDTSIAYYLEEARQFAALLDRITGVRFSRWSCRPQPDRLRVGLVSGDLRNHAVGHWLEGVVSQLDPARIELIAYPTHPQTDELSARVAPHFSAWKPLVDLADEEAARMIHADGVHVLIDVSGHTAGNRLGVFAWKPAPVQVTWLGYFATTGVKEVDYLLGDSFVTPEAEASHFSEEIWRLPESYLCFTPPNVALEVAELPALASGSITFGCFNNLAKMTDEVADLWAQILIAVPQSRLLLKTRQLNDSAIRDDTYQRFARRRIAADRLLLEGGSSRAGILAAYQRVDIALDPFPYPGGTTSIEAIWMGVPVVTRCGDRFLSHMGECILHNAGLGDWVAANSEDYLTKAVGFATDLERLSAIRSTLRQQALASPIFNVPRFARHFEAALWAMWQRWELAQGGLK